MAQQPNIELTETDQPRTTLDTAPARGWSTRARAGVIAAPDQVPSGEGFGTPGPDTGWALRIVRRLEPGLERNLEAVVVGLMGARAASFGRAPVRQDLEVAKLLCGIGEGLPISLSERLSRWMAAVPHERSKGKMAVAEVDRAILRLQPDELRRVL